MFPRSSVPVVLSAVVVCGCAYMGKAEVRVETGNQQSGYLSRPLGVTASSDESIQDVAQGICDNVKPGSNAKITFVGKTPGPGPFDFADWGRYRYDCESAPVAASTQPAVAADPPAPKPQTDTKQNANTDETRQRECLLQQGKYHICLGDCMINSTSALQTIASECQQHCAPKLPVGCN